LADYASVLTGGTSSYATTSEDINALATDILSQGVVGTIGNTSGVAPATGALAVNAQGTPNMTVAVTAGKAWVTVTPTSQGSQKLRANIAAQNATIAANSTGGTRYDWIYVAMSASGAANPAVDGTGVASITVSRSTSISTDNGTPPTYGYNIAKVTVANGATSITNGNIADMRSAITVASNSAADGWTTAEATPATVTGLGNRSYSLVFSSVDMTDTISPGMRLKLTRTVTAPTQCTDLESTSTQYYSKSSPSGMTFTDDFVCSAWIKLESYNTGAVQTIMARENGTSGWRFGIMQEGTVQLIGFNGGAGNYSLVLSRKTIPLNKWTHVSALLDMSAFTGARATAETAKSWIMIDGVEDDVQVTRAGTNPTALVQAGNLQVGKDNTINYFDGKIAQAAVYSTRVTQANIRATMSQTLSGSETSLISAYSFNNSIADLNTGTANDLTASGSAVATNADSPFAQGATGTTEYGVVTAASFSTNTTLTVQVPYGSAIPTSGGISAMSYSTHRCPYGFPLGADWSVVFRGNSANAGAVSAGTVYDMTNTLTVPVGSWRISYKAAMQNTRASSSVGVAYLYLSTSATAATDGRFTVSRYHVSNVASLDLIETPSVSNIPVSVTTATPYYFLKMSGTADSNFGVRGDIAPTVIIAECDYV